MKSLISFFKAQPVLVISFLAAATTMIFIPPDAKYVDYCNFSVLAELFALMIAVAGLRSVGLFENLTEYLLKKAGTLRRLSLIFVLLCFFSSMLITNDVALITFVPLTILAFARTDDDRSRIMTIVLETAAANLGSMLTPFGNPQNLFIYDRYGLTAGEFLMTMLPTGAVSLVCLVLLTLTVPRTECSSEHEHHKKIAYGKMMIYLVLFAVCIAVVFKLLPFWVCAAAAFLTALALDRGLLLKADYALLLTFVCFFIFVGNISRIDTVQTFLSGILEGNEILIPALLSQAISNVPAAVMLSGFTSNGTALLIGVNVGGLGTPIASMASLISLQMYRLTNGAKTKKYILCFSAVNFGMLAVLLVLSILVWQK